jgi:putative Holliday junction resolvase
MAHNQAVLALDVGEKRIGVALADPAIRIAVAYETIIVDGTEIDRIRQLISTEQVTTLVIGYPRNQSGEPTQQTAFVERFAAQLREGVDELVYQDESLTSVKAEEILKRQGKPYRKEDIDALAASLILQDYLECRHG